MPNLADILCGGSPIKLAFEARTQVVHHTRNLFISCQTSGLPSKCGTLKAVFPHRPGVQVLHETVYKTIYAQPRGEMRKELITCLRQGHTTWLVVTIPAQDNRLAVFSQDELHAITSARTILLCNIHSPRARKMFKDPLKTLADLASEAHARIQAEHAHINPVIEVRRSMRNSGIPADVMTIDCLRTRRRITLVLHDQQPGTLLYQFVTIEDEVGNEFQQLMLTDTSAETLFSWMQDYFG